MKNFVFIASHRHSGETQLREIMNNNPRLVVSSSSTKFDHPDALEPVMRNHKLGLSRAAVFGDTLLYNHSFSAPALYAYKFIYLIREPKFVIPALMSEDKLLLNNAFMYYSFRLRRLCEMASRTPDAVFLTYNDLKEGKGFDLIEKYLNLKESLSIRGIKFKEEGEPVPFEVLQKAQDCYERHLYYLNNLNLQKVSRS